MKLPIDVIAGTSPPCFQWTQYVSTPVNGLTLVNHSGRLPPSVEGAVVALIELAKHQALEIEKLKRAKVSAPSPTASLVKKDRG